MLKTLSSEEISNLTSNSICELIVLLRKFNKNNTDINNLMQELSKRRECGDSFNFESKLKEISKEIEEINSKMIFSEDQIE